MPVATVGLTTSTADRRHRAGQRLIVGLSGVAITDDERRLVREIQPGGFVLFSRNVAEPAQVRELNRELSSLLPAGFPPIRCVDQEGGRVQRVKAPATVWPPMAWVGNVNDLDFTRAVGKALALEVRALGFDLDFAPVADVQSNPKNPIIGDRSFGTDARRVQRHVHAFIVAMQDAGCIACAKHFPGHGDTATDSHLELPVVEKDPPDLEQTELPPFASSIGAAVGTIMTAHVLYPAWDEQNPATMSSTILDQILRRKLRFPGVLISDDLEMKAVRGKFPLEMQLDLASRATVDLFLCCKEPELQYETFETLVRLQEASSAEDLRAGDAVRRLHHLRERFLKDAPPPPDLSILGNHTHRDLAMRAEAEGRG